MPAPVRQPSAAASPRRARRGQSGGTPSLPPNAIAGTERNGRMLREVRREPLERVTDGDDIVGRRGDLEIVAAVPDEVDGGEADLVGRRDSPAVDRDRTAIHAPPGGLRR